VSALALARGGVCGASRDEVPTGALVGASSAAADRATVVCARAIALPELKSSCATVLVGIHRHQRGPAPPYKARNTQAIHCGQSSRTSAAAPNLSCSGLGGFVSDRARTVTPSETWVRTR
jgi:hypothetical protein